MKEFQFSASGKAKTIENCMFWFVLFVLFKLLLILQQFINNLIQTMHLEQQVLQSVFWSNFSKKQVFQVQNNMQYDPVQQFLDLKALCKGNVSFHQTQSEKDKIQTLHVEKDTNSANEAQGQLKPKKKSIFHNFQKHLITTLKNCFINTQNSMQERQVGQLCHKMWQSFKKTHSSNKQVLHMIFGLAKTKEYEAQFKKIAQKYPQFKVLCNNHDISKITDAQRTLRNIVIAQMQQISKEDLQASCNIQKFEVFYEYLQSFMVELAEGPMTSRMLKSRKSMVMTKLSKKNNDQ